MLPHSLAPHGAREPVPLQIARDVAAMARFAAARGWAPATSGNFSARISDCCIAITRSGVDKTHLLPEDVLRVHVHEAVPNEASAETPLHVARYRADRRIGAIMHVHSVAATVLSRAAGTSSEISLAGYEMQKAFAGVWTHESKLSIPVFENAQDMPALSEVVERRLRDGDVPGYVLAGHGMYVWGADGMQVRRHLEALEFLLTCALEERRLQR